MYEVVCLTILPGIEPSRLSPLYHKLNDLPLYSIKMDNNLEDRQIEQELVLDKSRILTHNGVFPANGHWQERFVLLGCWGACKLKILLSLRFIDVSHRLGPSSEHNSESLQKFNKLGRWDSYLQNIKKHPVRGSPTLLGPNMHLRQNST